MIRFGEGRDKNRVIQLLANSRIGAGFDRVDGPTKFTFPYDPAYAERLFLSHIEHPNMLCIVLDLDGPQGILMAVAYDHPFGPVRVARETVWWIEPQFRGSSALRMLESYENWARGQRCIFTGMAGMGDDPDVGRLYKRRGYGVAETHFLKAL